MFKAFFYAILASLVLATSQAAPDPIKSVASGPWSAAATWEGGHIPAAGDVVLIRKEHRVIYDVSSEAVIRSVHIAGTLSFSRDKDTLLCAGLVRIAPGEDCKEEGFDCHKRVPDGAGAGDRPVLEIGTPDAPIPQGRKAIVRLTYIEGMDKQSFPALLCCGGCMDLHGAPLNHPWIKLAQPGEPGSRYLELDGPVTGWQPGDHLVIPTTEMGQFYTLDKTGRNTIGSVLTNSQTEEAEISRVLGKYVELKQPLKFKHQAEGKFRGEVADLSRNVVVESADPTGVRGHTMYHRGSTGSISYAEFRHLGKEGVLGRYPIHFHMCEETMRGSSVTGASIWDSQNRWITIHDTDYLVIRDCVGYRSTGHGFFFEDGTEVFNVMDHNLAIKAFMGKPLPQQMLPFDPNDAAGFWWANCMNSFTRNVSVENEKYGYRFQMTKAGGFDPHLLIRQPDGTSKKVDVRTLPFLRFEGNEAHSQRRFALNLGGFHAQSTTEDLDRDGNVIDRMAYLGGDVEGVGPDASHPFRIKDLLVWRSHWGFHTTAPNVVIDGFTGYDINYVIWRSNVAGHDYNNLDLKEIHVSTFFNNWGAGKTRADLLRYAAPVDTLPPVTVITRVEWTSDRLVKVSGVTADDTGVSEVRVNGQLADLHPGPLTDWSAVILADGPKVEITAVSVDEAGNKELTPHHLVAIRDAQPAPASPVSASQPAMPQKEVPVKAEPVREAEVDAKKLKWPLWDGKETVAAYAKRAGIEPARTLSLNGEKLELVLVPAGSFLMGSAVMETGRAADEGPQHRVVISQPFYMGKNEVTQVQYEKVTGANPGAFPGKDHPVEQVSWGDAQHFLQKAGHGLRLPSEAEWEFACRAGTTTAFFTGDSLEDARRAGWYGYDDELQRATVNGESHPVGGKAANAFGLHDMHGNVYEWCADWYAPDYYATSPVLDPAGPATGDERVLRGGSWEATATSARSANRNGFSPNSHGYVVGFRVVQPLSSEK